MSKYCPVPEREVEYLADVTDGKETWKPCVVVAVKEGPISEFDHLTRHPDETYTVEIHIRARSK